MKIFLTGASGLVGAAFATVAYRAGHEVVGTVGRFSGPLPGIAERVVLDLADAASVTQAVLSRRPEVIVNCAAVSEPAACDADPVAAQRLNVVLPALLAQLAARIEARLLHLSSEQVFDGTRPPYAVNDSVCPINLYGRQKVESEKAVHGAAPHLAATVRAPLLTGNSPGGRRSLHERLLADWAAGKPAKLYVDEFRQPCSADNLADALLELATRRELCGVFHWAGADLLSRHELGLRMRAHFALSPDRAPIIALTRAENPAVCAQRQPNLQLRLEPLAQNLSTPVEPFSVQMTRFNVPSASQAWLGSARI